jgi:hypothetical protein
LSKIEQNGPATVSGCPLTLSDVQLQTWTAGTLISGTGGNVIVTVSVTGGPNLPTCVQGQDITVPVTLSGVANGV